MDTWKIAAFYRFTDVPDPADRAAEMRAAGDAAGLRGTILFAREGINGNCAGKPDAIDATLEKIRSFPGFEGLEARITFADFNPFPRLKVKEKNEIVTFRQPGADPRETVGAYVEPEQWNELLRDPDVLTIDTRNYYETRLGKFEGAIDPGTDDFHSFAEFVRTQLHGREDRKIAMYCTGGIRCERSTAFLKQHGFRNVYHLKGGILRYLQEVPPEQSLWRGDCFVFDYRVAVDHHLRPAPWKIDPSTGDPLPMDNEEAAALAERLKNSPTFRQTNPPAS